MKRGRRASGGQRPPPGGTKGRASNGRRKEGEYGSGVTSGQAKPEWIITLKNGERMAMKNGLYRRGKAGTWWVQYTFTGPHRCRPRDISGCPDDCPKRGQGKHHCRRRVAKCPKDCPKRGVREYRVIRESSHSTRRDDAEALLAKRTLARKSGHLIPDERKVVFEDLVRLIETDYELKQRHSRPKLGKLKEAFEGTPALAITTDRVKEYAVERMAAGAARATVNQELAALRRMFRLAIEVGRLTGMPVIHTPDPDNARQGFFEEADFRLIYKELPDYLQPLFEFAYLTGWRVKSEIAALTWGQVDFDAGVVRLEPGTTKNKDGRTFPFDALPRLGQLLEAQERRTRALEDVKREVIPWVFHRKGRQISDYYAAWRSAVKRAAGANDGRGRKVAIVRTDLLGRIPHDFRRTAVRNLERAGVPRSVAMKLTGHKTESVYRRYAIVAEADLREGVAKLAALHGATDQLWKHRQAASQ